MGEEFAVGSRVSARGLAWDVIEVAPLGAQTLLRLRCAGGRSGRPGMGHPASGRTGRAATRGAPAGCAGPAGGVAAAPSGLPAGTGARPGGHAVGGAGPGADRALPARSVDARTGIAAAAAAARRWRRTGQDDRGRADRLRADRAPAGAPRAGRRACRDRCSRNGRRKCGNASACASPPSPMPRPCRSNGESSSWAAIRSTRSRSA